MQIKLFITISSLTQASPVLLKCDISSETFIIIAQWGRLWINSLPIFQQLYVKWFLFLTLANYPQGTQRQFTNFWFSWHPGSEGGKNLEFIDQGKRPCDRIKRPDRRDSFWPQSSPFGNWTEHHHSNIPQSHISREVEAEPGLWAEREVRHESVVMSGMDMSLVKRKEAKTSKSEDRGTDRRWQGLGGA